MIKIQKSFSEQLVRLRRHFSVFIFMIVLGPGCNKIEWPGGKPPAEAYPPDVAVAWMNMQLRLTRGTMGFNSIVANRSFAYVGLSLYESIAPGIPGYQSIASQLSGSLTLPAKEYGKDYYWPASANAALAYISKNLFANTPASLVLSIDSLEADFNSKFQGKDTGKELQRSIAFGRKIAEAIFDWSKTDGGHEAYNNIISNTYIPPTGAGLWVPTPPGYSKPFHSSWGTNRSFIPGLLDKTQAAPPLSYSENPTSDFYKAVNEVYLASQQLSADDSVVAKFWADLPLNYNVPAHAANIVTQLILKKKLSLPEAAVLYCKHGIAGNESLIVCFDAKYKYNLVRPVTYIQNVLGRTTWNPLIPTPPFPEYGSAHAVVSSAFATVLEDAFGKNFSFTDHTYDHTYGPRTYSSFEEYAKEAAASRVLGGIHYSFTAKEGLKQGKIVGKEVNRLRFKK